MTYAQPPPTSAGAPPVHLGEILPPVPTQEAQAPSTSTDGAARIVALEGDITTLKGTVNQIAANMADLMALLRAPNRTSSNSIPPPGYGLTVDPNPWVPPTHASKAPLPMVFPAPSPHAPPHTSESLPFQAPQPHISFSYPALPPINIHIPEPGTPTQAVPIAPPMNFPLETETKQEQRLKKMEENIRALQSGGSRLDASDDDWSLFPGMRLPPKIKMPEFQRYHCAIDPCHHLRHYRGKMLQYWDYEEFVIHTFQDSLAGFALDWYMSLKAADIPTWANLWSKFIDQYKYCAETSSILLELSTMEQILLSHTSSFSNLIDAGKKLDIGVKLGKIEGPAEKREGESSKKAATRTPSTGSRRGKDASVKRCQLRAPGPSAIFHKLHARTTGHSSDQSRRCDTIRAHPATPPTTVGSCRERIQQMIDDMQLTFNAVKPPNMQANPLPDHESSSGPSINMIRVCAIEEYETGQEASASFVIEYVPAETTIQYARFGATPAPLVIEVPVREPYQDNKVSWTYKGSVGNLEHQFSVMGVTRSGRPHREALLKVLTAAQVPKETAPDLIEETVGSIFSNNISFSDDELPFEGYAHSRALHIVCKCNNFVVGRVMIDNDSALNVLHIPNAFNLLLARPWIHSTGAVLSTLHQKLKFIVEERLITVKGEEDYAIYKETVVPYISIGNDQNLPFPLVRHHLCHPRLRKVTIPRVPGSKHMGKGPTASSRSKSTRTRGDSVFALPATRLLKPAEASTSTVSQHIMGRSIGASQFRHFPTFFQDRRTLSEVLLTVPPRIQTLHLSICRPYASSPKRFLQGSTSASRRRMRSSITGPQSRTTRLLHSNPNLRRVDLNPSEELLEEPQPIYFGEGLDEDGRVANIVPVEKKDGRVKICVDYQDLNKASPKDNFPLSHIDVLVNNTARHTQFSFMDGFSGYNQNRMAEDDKIKTTFITI
ncbi:hypothetical protein CRG98_033390 [Punica granatum]|uniref:Retrotransposon gag domain-containing protein n=1 Tax=Punica granatum TaxID=22663 RepID=A0A2I0IQE3_PUNGR|nr:hypothetical protein CRG98_033390 [Punica granatum]